MKVRNRWIAALLACFFLACVSSAQTAQDKSGKAVDSKKPELKVTVTYLLGCCIRYDTIGEWPEGAPRWAVNESVMLGEVNTPFDEGGKRRPPSVVVKALAKIKGAELVLLNEGFIQVNPPIHQLSSVPPDKTEEILAAFDRAAREALATVYTVVIVGRPMIASPDNPH